MPSVELERERAAEGQADDMRAVEPERLDEPCEAVRVVG
jgi:hypothetical protein